MCVPEQANEFIWIYKPAGDVFFGPDTDNLQESLWYEQWVPNDHTIIQDAAGQWHVFGITHPLVETDPLHIGIHEGEYASFHAVSTARQFEETLAKHHYTDLPKVLPPKERPGEALANHAPFIIQKDSLYYMIYGPSPIRMAVSSDLMNWELKGKLFSDSDGARDPNILYHQGVYYAVYCSAKSVRMRQSKDLIQWSGPEIIFRSEQFDPESPSLIYFNNAFYLFVCSWDGHWDETDIQGAYQHKTHVLYSDSMHDFGTDFQKQITTLNAHAPEIIQDEKGGWYISSVEWPKRGVSVDRLAWVKYARRGQ